MPRLILTFGVPGCGKSTWATNYVKKHRKTVIVNLDDLRATMFGTIHDYKFKSEHEVYIKTIQKEQVCKLVEKGYSVIISDTNLHPTVFNSWKKFAKDNGMTFEFHDFFEEYLKECDSTVHPYFHLKKYRARCKDWNLKRDKSVPDDVIDKMVDTYLLPKYQLEQHVFNPDLPFCVVSDVDGTLMHMGKRNPYDESKVLEDTPDIAVCDSVQEDFKRFTGFIFSGRHEKCKDDTLLSLKQAGVVPVDIFMRADDDSRSDDIVKYELYMKHIHGKYNILRWYDDRDQVVRMLRDVGIKVYQVNPGNF